jgi:hypothetical protein
MNKIVDTGVFVPGTGPAVRKQSGDNIKCLQQNKSSLTNIAKGLFYDFKKYE